VICTSQLCTPTFTRVVTRAMLREVILLLVCATILLSTVQGYWLHTPTLGKGLPRRLVNYNTGTASRQSPACTSTRSVLSLQMDSYNDDDDEDSDESGPPVSVEPDLSVIIESRENGSEATGSDVRVGIIIARGNDDVVQNLYKVVTGS
jgi:hypothetical protein